MYKSLFRLMATLAFSGLLVTVSAGQQLITNYRLISVSQALRGNRGGDGREIVLVGKVIMQLGDSTYLFTDGTAKIKLEGGDNKLPLNAAIMVGGRIDTPFLGIGDIKFDVRRWKALGSSTKGGSSPGE